MNAIERHYRLTILAERIEQLDHDLALIPMQPGSGQNDVISARWHLMRAIQKIQAQPSPREQKRNLVATLERSIASVNGQKRCEEVSQTNDEGANAANVHPFSKPTTIQL
ncbi:MAG: hypothetical protein PHC88_05450 [Terrimicrobiaceae bacterium]|nr:hypothetical protein [Terrimicrobiaceae bacterium]